MKNRLALFYAVCGAAFIFCLNPADVSAEAGLVGHWKFDGSGTNEVASGPAAVTSGGATFKTDGGKIGGYAHVPAAGDYVSIPYSSVFDLPDSYTIEFWFRQRAARSSMQHLVYKGNPTNNYNFNIFRQLWNQYNTGPVIAGYTRSSNGYWTQVSNGNDMAHGEWHHVALTKSSSKTAYYLDGKLIHENTSDVGPAVTPAADIILGKTAIDTDFDNLRIYNRLLTLDEVLANGGFAARVQVCSQGQLRCSGAYIDTCASDGYSWQTGTQYCSYGCDEATVSCKSAPPSNSCSLSLTLNDGKTTYTRGDMVNYTYACFPSGTSSPYVYVILQKPDGTLTNYNTASGSVTGNTLGFGTSNLSAGYHTLKVCATSDCYVGAAATTTVFLLVDSAGAATSTTPTTSATSTSTGTTGTTSTTQPVANPTTAVPAVPAPSPTTPVPQSGVVSQPATTTSTIAQAPQMLTAPQSYEIERTKSKMVTALRTMSRYYAKLGDADRAKQLDDLSKVISGVATVDTTAYDRLKPLEALFDAAQLEYEESTSTAGDFKKIQENARRYAKYVTDLDRRIKTLRRSNVVLPDELVQAVGRAREAARLIARAKDFAEIKKEAETLVAEQEYINARLFIFEQVRQLPQVKIIATRQLREAQRLQAAARVASKKLTSDVSTALADIDTLVADLKAAIAELPNAAVASDEFSEFVETEISDRYDRVVRLADRITAASNAKKFVAQLGAQVKKFRQRAQKLEDDDQAAAARELIDELAVSAKSLQKLTAGKLTPDVADAIVNELQAVIELREQIETLLGGQAPDVLTAQLERLFESKRDEVVPFE